MAQETVGFQAEVKQLLQLIIHSVYSEREVFLRELVSNASDALDKLRFLSLSNQDLLGNDAELGIVVTLNSTDKTITIADNGVGMDRDEVKNNLGTIARSGTAEFLKSLSTDQVQNSNLIGKFGIGFYSAFIVAERVVVETLRAGTTEAVRWESKGDGEYTLGESTKATRGTTITMHLREDAAAEFLNPARVRRTIRNYSDHIAFKITMIDTATSINEQINRAAALWQRPKRDVTQQEYKEFYRHVSHDYREPLTWVHSKIEGRLQYSLLLYVPSRAPFNMWSQDAQHGVRLYVRRVFVAEGAKSLLPAYLRFVRGVIESDDLQLNVSRELLQNNRIIAEISSEATKKVLSLLEDLGKTNPVDYATFWTEFGEAIKEGVGDDVVNRDQLKQLLRFASTHLSRDEQSVSLADYVSRMKPEQKEIYYLAADAYGPASHSPLLELFRKKGVEVLLLTGRNDPWLMSQLTDFDGKSFVSVASANVDLSAIPDVDTAEAKTEADKEKKAEPAAEEFSSVTSQMGKILGERVHEVVLSKRLETSPACLVAQGGGDLKTLLQRSTAGAYRPGNVLLEINPRHTLIARLKNEGNESRFKDWTEILYQEAVLSAGGELEDPSDFVRRMNGLLESLVHTDTPVGQG